MNAIDAEVCLNTKVYILVKYILFWKNNKATLYNLYYNDYWSALRNKTTAKIHTGKTCNELAQPNDMSKIIFDQAKVYLRIFSEIRTF